MLTLVNARVDLHHAPPFSDSMAVVDAAPASASASAAAATLADRHVVFEERHLAAATPVRAPGVNGRIELQIQRQEDGAILGASSERAHRHRVAAVASRRLAVVHELIISTIMTASQRVRTHHACSCIIPVPPACLPGCRRSNQPTLSLYAAAMHPGAFEVATDLMASQPQRLVDKAHQAMKELAGMWAHNAAQRELSCGFPETVWVVVSDAFNVMAITYTSPLGAFRDGARGRSRNRIKAGSFCGRFE